MFNFIMTDHTVIDHIWVYLHLVNVKIISALARKQEVLKTQLHRWKHHFKSIHKICKRTNPALNKYSVIYSFFLSEIAVVWMVATAAHQSICHLQVLVSVHRFFTVRTTEGKFQFLILVQILQKDVVVDVKLVIHYLA